MQQILTVYWVIMYDLSINNDKAHSCTVCTWLQSFTLTVFLNKKEAKNPEKTKKKPFLIILYIYNNTRSGSAHFLCLETE